MGSVILNHGLSSARLAWIAQHFHFKLHPCPPMPTHSMTRAHPCYSKIVPMSSASSISIQSLCIPTVEMDLTCQHFSPGSLARSQDYMRIANERNDAGGERPISVVRQQNIYHDFIHSLQPASRESSSSLCIGVITLESIE